MTGEEAIRTILLRLSVEPEVIEEYLQRLTHRPGHKRWLPVELSDDELSSLSRELTMMVRANEIRLPEARVKRALNRDRHDNPFLPRNY